MHSLVRNLYKQVLLVGKDYPHPEGINYVRRKWKEAIRNTENWPLNHAAELKETGRLSPNPSELEKEIRLAVGKGRFMVKEMIGIIQVKKYREMKKRYDGSSAGHKDQGR
jgi:hypothetical protein